MKDYETKWQSGLPETVCGRGSKLENTVLIRDILPEIVAAYEVETIADVGCGDQNWIHHVEWPHHVEYDGYDIAHKGIRFNCIEEVLPQPYDLIMTIYVLNHIYVKGGVKRAIKNFQASGSRMLLTTFSNDSASPYLGRPAAGWFHKTKSGRDWYYGLFRL